MAVPTCRANEVLHFTTHMPIELCFERTVTYGRDKRLVDPKQLSPPMLWHQIVVLHNGRLSSTERRREILNALFEVVEDEEIFPVAYRVGDKQDRFLVRQCPQALNKLFACGLRLRLQNGAFFPLLVQLNVGAYTAGQISSSTEINRALCYLYDDMEKDRSQAGILNLSRFASHRDLSDIVVDLGNRGVFQQICNLISRNDNKMRSINGIILSHNNIKHLEPLQVFVDKDFLVIDLRYNKLSSGTGLCKTLKELKTEHLLLAGNPLTKSPNYPTNLQPILGTLKLLDGTPVETLSKDYTPLTDDIEITNEGHRIDWSNKGQLHDFIRSEEWHAVMIPDREQKYTMAEIFAYFFSTMSPKLSKIFPCYYKFISGEHQFLVRLCVDQLLYLAETCNFQIKVPRSAAKDCNQLEAVPMDVEEMIFCYLLMNISRFKRGHIDPLRCIDSALSRRFDMMQQTLNLSNFQDTKDLDKIIVHMGMPKVLGFVLVQVSRKYLSHCTELCLTHNGITAVPQALSMMRCLRKLDLGSNHIADISDIAPLSVLPIKSLRLDRNPLCAKYGTVAEYVTAVNKYFPQLVELDNVTLSDKMHLKSQQNFLCDIKGYDLVEKFVPHFLKAFESKQRVILKELYHPGALFSLNFNYEIIPKAMSTILYRLTRYAQLHRNITKGRNPLTNLFVGPHEIGKVFSALPVMKFDMFSLTTDVPVFNEQMVVIIVSGVFKDIAKGALEIDLLLSFNRTFILTPVEKDIGFLKGGTKYQIINDQLTISKPTTYQTQFTFKYSKRREPDTVENNDVVTVEEQEHMLIMLQELTGLKTIWCKRCLKDGGWDFQKALGVFLKLAEDEIPEEAYNEQR